MPYPAIEPFRTGRLPVGQGHDLYYEECGSPDGRPVVFLHGGPGSGCKPKHRRYFDPARYRIVLLDQRGSGRSRPLASVADNTTAHLVADIEALRRHLGISRWAAVFGISWGTTLGLAYAQAWPERVATLVLEGVFLGTDGEIAWWFGPDGVARFFPAEYQSMIALVPPAARTTPQGVMDHYFAAMTGADPQRAAQAIQAWSRYEYQFSWLEITPEEVEQKLADPNLISHSLLECHYFRNRCFLSEGQLLKDVERLGRMRVIMVQSRYDMVCPPGAAFALAQRVPHAELTLIPRSGHVLEGSAEAAVVAVFDGLADLPPSDR